MPRFRRKKSSAMRPPGTSFVLIISICLLTSPSSINALIGNHQQLRPAHVNNHQRSLLPIPIATYTGRRRRRRNNNASPILVTASPSSRDDLDFLATENENDPGDDDNDNDNEGGDYPSMGFSGDYAQEPLLQIYARDKKWLEKATEDMTDEEQYPLGELTQDDIASITGLMVAWVRRRSVSAGLAVEKLLVRVVADMRAGNPVAQTTARMYSLAMDAWAKSGVTGSAERAQHIHDTMTQFYKETGDEALRPTAASYNILINAHGKSSDLDGLDNAERVLQEMIDSDDEEAKPDSVSFSTLLDSYAKSADPMAVDRTLKLLDLMDEMNIGRNAYIYTALQNVYATSRKPNAAQKAMEVLEEMLDLYENGNPVLKPSCMNYNSVLGALSRSTNGTIHATLADDMLRKMQLPFADGGYDVEPDKLSYALAILTCSRCPAEYGTAKAEELLLDMEERAKIDEKKRLEVSSAAPPSVVLNLESFNLVLIALSKTRSSDAVQRMIDIIGRMKDYSESGYPNVFPTVRSWNALLNAISRSRGSDKTAKAEKIIEHMYNLYDDGVPRVKPDAFSFAALLTAYARSESANAMETMTKMEDTLERMQNFYENGDLETPPDVYHYTIVINAWAKSGLPLTAQRAMQLLAHMTKLAAQGNTAASPNVRTYHAVLDCLARGGAEGEAERLLDHMLIMERQGETCVDSFCFDSVIFSFCKSKKKGCGKRAESVLERLLNYSQERPSCRPKARSFKQILSLYRASKEPDAPYRAEDVLNRQIDLFKDGATQLEPDSLSFKLVMDTYSSAKHKDAGITAERLLKQMRDLQEHEKTTKICVDGAVMYCVLYAWLVSGDDDAGRHAEMHLDTMERMYKAGDENYKPDSRLYGLVLNAWSKSNSFEKAQRAYNVLQRMENQHKNGNEDVQPNNEHCHSLVINACAFTNSGQESEREAFRIAVETFDKMIASEDCKPSSLAYGWYIQACGRLKVVETERFRETERAWKLCCENGLVTAFVLHRFTGSASEALYKKLLGPVMSELGLPMEETKEKLKFKINPSNLPLKWTQHCRERTKESGSKDWWNAQ